MDRLKVVTLTVGIIGGIALIATTASTTRGPVILLPYAGILTTTAVALKMLPTTTFRQRVWAATTVFMCSSLMLYGYILVVDNPAALHTIGVVGHVWRLAFIAGIAFPLSTMLAYLTSHRGEQVG